MLGKDDGKLVAESDGLVLGNAVVGADVTGAVVDGDAETGATVVGRSVTGALVAGPNVKGAAVVGASVNGASSVGSGVTGALDVGAKVTGDFVTGNELIGAFVAGAFVRETCSFVGDGETGFTVVGSGVNISIGRKVGAASASPKSAVGLTESADTVGLGLSLELGGVVSCLCLDGGPSAVGTGI